MSPGADNRIEGSDPTRVLSLYLRTLVLQCDPSCIQRTNLSFFCARFNFFLHLLFSSSLLFLLLCCSPPASFLLSFSSSPPLLLSSPPPLLFFKSFAILAIAHFFTYPNQEVTLSNDFSSNNNFQNENIVVSHLLYDINKMSHIEGITPDIEGITAHIEGITPHIEELTPLIEGITPHIEGITPH